MIMKANKQIGFIYKDNESIDRILKDGEVVFERGFLREKTSTTLPITFGGVGKNLKDYKIYGNTKQQILPDGYTQVEYIESSGTQYIDTCIKGNNNTLINLKIKVNSRSNVMHLLGDITDTSKAISFNLDSSATPKSRWGNLEKNIAFPVNTTDLFEITLSEEGYYVDKTIYWNPTHNDFETKNNMFLFSANGSTSNKFDGRIYSCKVYDNNVLACDFIPCYRNSDNEVGLYDLVNNVFYTNQGTGSFTYGSVAPTPDAPIEIVNCGDRTKNLCGELEQGGYNETTGAKITSSNYRNKEPIKVLPSTNYIFSINGVGQAINAFEYRADGTYIGRIGAGSISANTYFTTSSETAFINIFRGTSAGIEKWQIEQSDTVTPYEPYGYKIPVNVRSENLFDKDNANILNAAFSDNGKKVSSSQNGRTLYIKCKPNTTYTVTKKARERFRLLTTETLPSIDVVGNNYQFGDTNSVLTIETTSNDNYLCVYYYLYGTDTLTEQQILDSIMIVEGSTAPSKYIPYYNETTNIYLDEPLRKIDEYSDYIDFISGKVVRNVSSKLIDGSLDWVTGSFASIKRIYTLATTNISNKIKAPNENTEKATIISDKYKTESIEDILTATKKYAIGLSKTNYLSIQNQDYTYSADLIQSLTDNPVELCYALSTPVEETITLPNIPTIDGNNTLNIETELTPSQVYIKYKSNT